MLRKTYISIFILTTIISFAQNNYYIGCDTEDLILADYQNCSYQVVCNTGLTMYDIAITPNQNLYSTDGKKVYKINKFNCTNTIVTNTPVTDTLIGGGAWITSLVALDDNYLFAADGGALLYKIDLVNGTSAIIDTIKQYINDSLTYWYGSGGDLTWYKSKLLFVTYNNDLVEITLDATYNSITNLMNIGHLNTPGSSVYGALTIGQANCDEDNLKVLAFEASDVYLVNPQNASLQMLCSSNFPCGVNGATSLTEIKNQDYTSEFLMPNVFTPNGDNVNDVLRPTVAKNITNVDINIYNRWGNLVYKETSETFKWDGLNFDNKKCVDGVYFYILEYKNICDKTEKMSGYITLIK